MVADSPGIERVRRSPTRAPSVSAARKKNPTADRGEANHFRTVDGSGKIASCPFKGSRIMPEKKLEAARFGLPGRTQIVGNRIPIPSKKPFLVKSASNNSPIAFWVPYEVRGVEKNSSPMISGNGAPKTAIELVNMTRGRGLASGMA